jgi:hypothetical protein
VWSVRDSIVLIYGLLFKFVIIDMTSWWAWPFVWVRLLAILGHRVGGRYGRSAAYAMWLGFCIWVRLAQGNWVRGAGWLTGWRILGVNIKGYMPYAALGDFEAMYWLGLELGPLLRSFLQRRNYLRDFRGRYFVALACVATLVFLPGSEYRPTKNLIGPACNTLLATFALGGFVLFTFPAGRHLPSGWVFSSVAFSRPMYSVLGLGKVVDLMPYFIPKVVWQMHQNGQSSPQGWLWSILFVISVWSLLLAYYIVIGVLVNEVCRSAVRGIQFLRKGLCRHQMLH